jgi:hypothetical protein
MRRHSIIVGIFLSAVLASACQPEEVVTIPETFPKMPVPENNQLTREDSPRGRTRSVAGRVLLRGSGVLVDARASWLLLRR